MRGGVDKQRSCEACTVRTQPAITVGREKRVERTAVKAGSSSETANAGVAPASFAHLTHQTTPTRDRRSIRGAMDLLETFGISEAKDLTRAKKQSGAIELTAKQTLYRE